MNRQLFLHVGIAKCGSTSLQAALSSTTGVLYPTSGRHGGEHLAFALRIRGVDNWTSQFFDQSWVDTENTRLMQEIQAGTGVLVMSSERLAASTREEIERIADVLSGFEVRIIIVKRDLDSYIKSTWRHSVFFHDLAEGYEAFVDRFKDFTFDEIEDRFRAIFPLHCFNLDAPNYGEEIGALLGTKLNIPIQNVGVPMALAELLQKTHALLGTEEFKKRFDAETKQSMLDVWNGTTKRLIQALDAVLF